MSLIEVYSYKFFAQHQTTEAAAETTTTTKHSNKHKWQKIQNFPHNRENNKSLT